MALAKCLECGKDVSTSAATCPHCGLRNPAVSVSSGGKRVLIVGTVLFVIVALLNIGNTGSSGGSSSATTSNRSSAPPPPIATTPPLELLSYNWEFDGDYVIVRGQVKNVSAESLKSVAAVVTYYDKNGGFITSDDAMIDYQPVLPGQTSPFRITERANPAMKTASVEFKKMFGGTIPHTERKR